MVLGKNLANIGKEQKLDKKHVDTEIKHSWFPPGVFP